MLGDRGDHSLFGGADRESEASAIPRGVCWGLASVEFSMSETASAMVRMMLEGKATAPLAGPPMTAAVCQPRWFV